MRAGRDLAAFIGVRLMVGLFGLVPAGVARSIGELGGSVWYRLAPGRRSMAVRHMRRVLGDDADAESAARSVFRSYGRYWAETFWVRPRRVDAMFARTTLEGREHVDRARKAGRGAVFALPHLGNWEVAGPVAIDVGLPAVAVAERLPNRRITDWFMGLRSAFGLEIVLTGDRLGVTRSLEQALADGKAVALLCDRDLKRRGIPVVFFGEETTLPVGPARLALKTGAPLLPVASYFEEGGHRIVVRPPIPLDLPGGLPAVMQELATQLEGLIRAAPDQWHLLQPNWPSDRVSTRRAGAVSPR